MPSVQPPCPCCSDCTISASSKIVTISPIENEPVARCVLLSPSRGK